MGMDRIANCNDRSPVKIIKVSPLKTGNGLLSVELFHAYYPEGVQFKKFDLRIVVRTEHAVGGVDEDGRLFVFSELNRVWLEVYWKGAESEFNGRDDPSEILERAYFP